MAILVEYRNDDIGARLRIDDDDKTAYAYVLLDEKIVGDVWLYNVKKTPVKPEWSDPSRMPFLNPTEFASNEVFEPIDDESQIAIDWEVDSGNFRQVNIYLRDKKHAVLGYGSKPGWCRLGAKTGPLARPLDEVR